MPIYEFVCRDCAFRFERLQHMRFLEQHRSAVCPQCGAPDAELVPSVSAFALKGAGFHANDYPRS